MFYDLIDDTSCNTLVKHFRFDKYNNMSGSLYMIRKYFVIDHLSLKNILNNYHFNANYFENNIISE
jgi:hypothetical protein